MSVLGSLISAGGNLLGGYFNNQQQNKINSQNVAEAQWSAEGGYLPGLVKNANDAGLNPLAVLGNNAPSMPVAVGSSPGDSVAKSGQDIGRAVAAMADTRTKSDALNEQLLQAKIDNTNADTTRIMADASQQRRNLGAPGTPPSFPLPQSDPRYTDSIEPATTRFRMPDGSVVARPSSKFTQSNFSINPTGPVDALRIDAASGQVNPNPGPSPDVARSIQNLQMPAPPPYTVPYGMD